MRLVHMGVVVGWSVGHQNHLVRNSSTATRKGTISGSLGVMQWSTVARRVSGHADRSLWSLEYIAKRPFRFLVLISEIQIFLGVPTCSLTEFAAGMTHSVAQAHAASWTISTSWGSRQSDMALGRRNRGRRYLRRPRRKRRTPRCVSHSLRLLMLPDTSGRWIRGRRCVRSNWNRAHIRVAHQRIGRIPLRIHNAVLRQVRVLRLHHTGLRMLLCAVENSDKAAGRNTLAANTPDRGDG